MLDGCIPSVSELMFCHVFVVILGAVVDFRRPHSLAGCSSTSDQGSSSRSPSKTAENRRHPRPTRQFSSGFLSELSVSIVCFIWLRTHLLQVQVHTPIHRATRSRGRTRQGVALHDVLDTPKCLKSSITESSTNNQRKQPPERPGKTGQLPSSTGTRPSPSDRHTSIFMLHH